MLAMHAFSHRLVREPRRPKAASDSVLKELGVMAYSSLAAFLLGKSGRGKRCRAVHAPRMGEQYMYEQGFRVLGDA